MPQIASLLLILLAGSFWRVNPFNPLPLPLLEAESLYKDLMPLIDTGSGNQIFETLVK